MFGADKLGGGESVIEWTEAERTDVDRTLAMDPRAVADGADVPGELCAIGRVRDMDLLRMNADRNREDEC